MLKNLRFWVPTLIIAGGVIWGGSVFWSVGDNTGYAPVQPIAFNHQLHAGQMKIPCMYCHSGAYRSRSAVVPASNVCMNCHSVVATDKPEVQKVRAAYQEGKPIEWVKVHDLPDFVYFSHKRHISKGVACEECHGKVETMSRVRQVKSLKMGWCLECHRGKDAEGKPRNGPTDCSGCHN